MTDRVALVTGAGMGIGRATALELARRGARVMATSRTRSDLEAVAAEHERVEYVVGDVSTEAGCQAIVDETARRLGPVDILVNNAGMGSARERPIWEQPSDVWREMVATNLDGPFWLTRMCASGMRERRFGRVIMVSSTAGEHGAQQMSAYCASKHGLLGLMRAAAQDLAPFDVTCNAVNPGWVRTDMADRSAAKHGAAADADVEEIWAQRAASYAAGRVLTPQEIANVIAFLASDEASGVNGEAVTVALGSVW
jgi:NAD(P)-dependent dehydrogenase (short-subunit alcohol dehydrogenase family)